MSTCELCTDLLMKTTNDLWLKVKYNAICEGKNMTKSAWVLCATGALVLLFGFLLLFCRVCYGYYSEKINHKEFAELNDQESFTI
jgi:hypothetical protein